jgi:hypothetical protein
MFYLSIFQSIDLFVLLDCENKSLDDFAVDMFQHYSTTEKQEFRNQSERGILEEATRVAAKEKRIKSAKLWSNM